ncbi:Glu-tRNA(Gln) amidotransferase subunit GatD [Candidatus Woesearchaeota archaeon]|nr:Glu-tRNA(Gln) amidotransferase subunit GatD [Candidatus Woesearchaeota archaeon]
MAKITTKDEVLEGTIMNETKDAVVLKLKSGYNLGVLKKKIKETVRDEPPKKEPSLHAAQHRQDSSLPLISILHTGGTIASKVDYTTGGVTAQFSPDELIDLFPELTQHARIRSRLVRKMMSENMRFDHYNLLAQAVEEEIKAGSSGVIITHGTDTLHYSSAALSFVLEQAPIPVLFVGAQRSSDRGSSDAALNLLSAVLFITTTDYAGVAICMHHAMDDTACDILHGCKARKMHTSRRDAFRPINTTAIAHVEYAAKKITFLQQEYPRRSSANLRLRLFDPQCKVGLLKTYTHMYAEQFKVFKGYGGLVLEGTGLGQLPNVKTDDATAEHEKIMAALKTLSKKTLLVMAPQTIYGRVNMNVYAEGRLNLSLGMLGHLCDMTPETAYLKLAWLLSNYTKEEARELYGKNLRGEISERIAAEETFE